MDSKMKVGFGPIGGRRSRWPKPGKAGNILRITFRGGLVTSVSLSKLPLALKFSPTGHVCFLDSFSVE